MSPGRRYRDRVPEPPTCQAPPGTIEARAEARDHVLRAARRCFQDTGVRRTTMEAVARAAGLSRQTVYKLFLGRRELVEAAVAARIGELADEIAARYADGSSLAEGFVAASVEVIEGIRGDHELATLLGEGSPVALHEVLWLEPIAQRGVRFWRPWLQRARAEGALRPEITDEDLSDWLQTVYASLILRRGLGPAGQRAVIERFVLPSIAALR
jgi:AcrR family transcriptional regulator